MTRDIRLLGAGTWAISLLALASAFGSEAVRVMTTATVFIIWPIAAFAPELWAGRADVEKYKRLGIPVVVAMTASPLSLLFSPESLGAARSLLPLSVFAALLVLFRPRGWRNISALGAATIFSFSFVVYSALEGHVRFGVGIALAGSATLCYVNLARICDSIQSTPAENAVVQGPG